MRKALEYLQEAMRNGKDVPIVRSWTLIVDAHALDRAQVFSSSEGVNLKCAVEQQSGCDVERDGDVLERVIVLATAMPFAIRTEASTSSRKNAPRKGKNGFTA